jgi:hypothetical protein
MVAWWTSAEYLKKHAMAKKKREAMGGGSHRQGSLTLARCKQKEVSKCILYSCFSRYSLLRKGVSFSPIFMLSFAENKDRHGAHSVWDLDPEAYQEGAASSDRVDVDDQGKRGPEYGVHRQVQGVQRRRCRPSHLAL